MILLGSIATRWGFAPGASGQGVAPRAAHDTSSNASVASTATPCTITLQPTPAEETYSSISNETFDPGACDSLLPAAVRKAIIRRLPLNDDGNPTEAVLTKDFQTLLLRDLFQLSLGLN